MNKLFIVIFGICSFSYAQNPFDSNEKEVINRESWSQNKFTKPEHFGPENFLYIVNTSSSFYLRGLNGLNDWTIKLLNNPELITHNPKISASVIRNDHKLLIGGNFGFIMSVPKELYVATYDQDMGTMMPSSLPKEELLLSLSNGPISDLNEVLESSIRRGIYNEVIFPGSYTIDSKFYSVKIEGLWIKCEIKYEKLLSENIEIAKAELKSCLKNYRPSRSRKKELLRSIINFSLGLPVILNH